MAIESRHILKTYFETGDKPSEQEFANLIESLLNMRDDQFWGYWKPGIVYKPGDVVIHERSLWIMTKEEDLCADVPPSEDNPDWEEMILRADDGDWQIDGEDLYAKVSGNVGIGTTVPLTRLEVTNEGEDGPSGRFLFNLEHHVNPALSIVNCRPDTQKRYLASGVDNDRAVFVSDSEHGFVFRKGGLSNETKVIVELNINQGEDLLIIGPEGKVALGKGAQMPEDYELNVNGDMQARTLYSFADRHDIEVGEEIENVLDKVNALRPVRFEWKEHAGPPDAGEQLGLVAHELEEYFPEVVKTAAHHGLKKAVAYPNLVPVLIQAIKEQQAQIEAQAERLQQLESLVASIADASETE